MKRRFVPVAAIILMAASAVLLLIPSGKAPIAGPHDLVPSVGGAATLAVIPVRSVLPGDGRETTIAYTLGNDGSRPRTYAVSATELSPTGNALPDGASNAGRWIRPASPRVVVPAHTSRTTKVRVRVPADHGASERRVGITFRDETVIPGGTVTVRAQITTSLYVHGTGAALRRASLSRLHVPLFAHREIDVRAALANRGTVYLVPGSTTDPVVGTLSTGTPFTLGGDVAPPNASVPVLGIARDLPFACWCQVRLSVPDGKGGTSTLTGRTLVAPWPQIALAAAALLILLVVRYVRRRARTPKVLLRTVRSDDNTPSRTTSVVG